MTDGPLYSTAPAETRLGPNYYDEKTDSWPQGLASPLDLASALTDVKRGLRRLAPYLTPHERRRVAAVLDVVDARYRKVTSR